jgi:hypothetical protein
VKQRLEDLLRKDKEEADRGPSLRRFLRHQLGFDGKANGVPDAELPHGRPFPELYERGRQFSSSAERNQRYDTRWLVEYSAYLYYRLHNRLCDVARFVWAIVRYAIMGTP